MIASGVPHRERIRYATRSEFFTGSALTDRHDLPHPIFRNCTMESIPLKTAIQKSNTIPGHPRSHANRRQKHSPQSQPWQGCFASRRRTSPFGMALINRRTAINSSL
ncbi:hypothetical protein ACV229_25805 [Burkholderia sp. MR1-5-21]